MFCLNPGQIQQAGELSRPYHDNIHGIRDATFGRWMLAATAFARLSSSCAVDVPRAEADLADASRGRRGIPAESAVSLLVPDALCHIIRPK